MPGGCIQAAGGCEADSVKLGKSAVCEGCLPGAQTLPVGPKELGPRTSEYDSREPRLITFVWLEHRRCFDM